MKYFMLTQWVNENRKNNLFVEKIYLSETSLVIRFKDHYNLILYYKTSNPFPWFSDIKVIKTTSSTPLWSGLQNSELCEIRISESDRILHFIFKYMDIYQKQIEQVLVFECMPPQGNVILCRPENGKLIILDALNKYTYADNPQRQILAGLTYETPRTNFKATVEKVIYPLELKPADGTSEVLCPTMNEYFLQYFQLVVQQKEQAQKKHRLQSHWLKELAKAKKKLSIQHDELKEAEKEKTWLTYSEIIKINLQKIQKGATELEAVNYFDPEMQLLKVPLKVELSPRDNLKRYLKKYNKAKQGREKISLQIEKTVKNIERINEIIALFATDRWQDLISDTNRPTEVLKKLKQTDSLFRLTVNEDWEILIGRKAKENDLISTQIGKPNDWWFHTRIYHGSHILLRNYHKKEPSPVLLELCCRLAAWFSKAKNSENVPVDYTQIRYVRKPRKSPPGYVTYTNQKTVFANPIDVNSAKEILLKYA